jgi:hypothetical protein
MSEKIFSWLLRLYPAHFRQTYKEEALQLFRDRAREERGFGPRLRLWFDLILDLVVTVPREYWRPQQEAIAISAAGGREGTPAFVLLKTESPHPKVFFLGAGLSLLVLLASAMAMSHSELYTGTLLLVGPSIQSEFSDEAPPSTTSSSRNPVVPRKPNLTEAERSQVIRTVVEDLKNYYVDPDVGQKMADAVVAREKHGDYDDVTDGGAFARSANRPDERNQP